MLMGAVTAARAKEATEKNVRTEVSIIPVARPAGLKRVTEVRIMSERQQWSMNRNVDARQLKEDREAEEFNLYQVWSWRYASFMYMSASLSNESHRYQGTVIQCCICVAAIT